MCTTVHHCSTRLCNALLSALRQYCCCNPQRILTQDLRVPALLQDTDSSLNVFYKKKGTYSISRRRALPAVVNWYQVTWIIFWERVSSTNFQYNGGRVFILLPSNFQAKGFSCGLLFFVGPGSASYCIPGTRCDTAVVPGIIRAHMLLLLGPYK